jgi:hypothetical protein
MTVIALVMEVGTYDRRFAARLAERLHIGFADMTCLERDVAERSHSSDTIMHRMVGQCRQGPKWRSAEASVLERIRSETLATAAGGDVLIHGWCASAVLRPVEHAICVRIGAPMQWRERNVMRQCAFNAVSTARLEIASTDALVGRLVKRVSRADWRDPALYHLMLSAEGLADEACAGLISDLAKSWCPPEVETPRDVLATLAANVRKGDESGTRGGLGCNGVAIVDSHEVTLSARDSHEDAIAKAERYLHGERRHVRHLPSAFFDQG